MRRLAGLVSCTVVAGALVGAGCTPKTAPLARSVGKVMSIGGVVGLIGTGIAARYIGQGQEMLYGFSVISGIGLVTYATAEMTQPRVEYVREPIPQRNHRWAKTLTERASGAAREGRCARVRRLEPRVAKYDAAVHDLLFMKDPEILKCLAAPAPASGLYPDGAPPPVLVPETPGPLEQPVVAP